MESSLRGAQRRSNPENVGLYVPLDCFASLAMTITVRPRVVQGALALLSASMSACVNVSSVARTRLSVCWTEVALAIGAVTPGLAMAQASATSAGFALWLAAA